LLLNGNSIQRVVVFDASRRTHVPRPLPSNQPPFSNKLGLAYTYIKHCMQSNKSHRSLSRCALCCCSAYMMWCAALAIVYPPLLVLPGQYIRAAEERASAMTCALQQSNPSAEHPLQQSTPLCRAPAAELPLRKRAPPLLVLPGT
jgi:hypothetical protein